MPSAHQSAKHEIDAINKANAILRKGGDRAYYKAVRALLPDSRDWWEKHVQEDEYAADAEGLASFLTEQLYPLCRQMASLTKSTLQVWLTAKAATSGTRTPIRLVFLRFLIDRPSAV